MENKYKNKDGKIVENVGEVWFNEYNMMSFRSLSAYQKHIDQLKEDHSKLVQSLAVHFEENGF